MKLSMLMMMAATSVVAATKTWTGAGDGVNWNDSNNWDDGCPADGDSVVLTNATDSAITINNDMTAVRLAELRFVASASGTAPITLTGNTITLKANSNIRLCRDFPNIYTPFIIEGNFNIDGQESEPYQRRIEAGGNFYAPITAAGRMMMLVGKQVSFYAPVDMTSYTGAYATGAAGCISFSAMSNNISGVVQSTYSYTAIDCENAFNDDFTFNWGAYHENDNCGRFIFTKSCSITCDHIGGDIATTEGSTYATGKDGYNHGRKIAANGNTATIIQHSKCDVVTEALLDGNLSVVWAPVDEYTQTFNLRTHTTTGKITVKNGGVVVAGGASFAKLTGIEVSDGARFVVGADAGANVLAGLKTLALGKGTVFNLSAYTGALPTALDRVDICCDARDFSSILLPDGVNITVKVLTVNGEYVASGELEMGQGKFTVLNTNIASWKEDKTSGNFSDGANWVAGTVPTATDDAFIEVATAPTVTMSQGTVFNTLTVGNGATLTTDGTDGEFYRATDNTQFINITNGATMVVSAGVAAFVGYNERAIRVSKGGTLRVSGGELNAKYGANSWMMPLTCAGGTIEVCGDGKLSTNSNGEPSFGYGEVKISDNGVFTFPRGDIGGKSDMTITITDNGKLYSGSGTMMGRNYQRTRTIINVYSKSNQIGEETYIGCNNPSYSEVNVYTGGAMTVGAAYQCYVGSAQSAVDSLFATGVVNVVGGAVALSGHYHHNPAVDNYKVLRGLIVGGRNEFKNSSNIMLTHSTAWPVGKINVTDGGSMTVTNGFVAVGIGLGHGEINISGGTFLKRNANAMCIIGAGEAEGSLSVSEEGNFTTPDPMYVGAFTTNVTATMSIPRWWEFYPNDSLSATGRVSVATLGSVVCSKDAFFGTHGTGILEVGAGGNFSAANLTLGANPCSQLKFVMSAATGGSVNVSGTLTVEDGAELIVDAMNFTGTKSCTLLSAAQQVGAFTDVTLAAPNPKLLRVVAAGGVVRLVPKLGTVINLR